MFNYIVTLIEQNELRKTVSVADYTEGVKRAVVMVNTSMKDQLGKITVSQKDLEEYIERDGVYHQGNYSVCVGLVEDE